VSILKLVILRNTVVLYYDKQLKIPEIYNEVFDVKPNVINDDNNNNNNNNHGSTALYRLGPPLSEVTWSAHLWQIGDALFNSILM
jgi:hypothetical protein